MLPILEYCCLKIFCKPNQSTFIGLNDFYHNLASPVRVKQNLCTLTLYWNPCVSIQSFVLSNWASASLFGFLEYSGLKWDQCNKGTCGVGRCSASGVGGAWGALGIKGICGFWWGGGFSGARESWATWATYGAWGHSSSAIIFLFWDTLSLIY